MFVYIYTYKYISFTKYKYKILLAYMYLSKHRVKFVSRVVFILTVAFLVFRFFELDVRNFKPICFLIHKISFKFTPWKLKMYFFFFQASFTFILYQNISHTSFN